MRIFISANNTNCGKTYTSLKLIKAFSEKGYKVGVIKPIETGILDIPEDGTILFNEAKKYNHKLNSLNINDIVPIKFTLPAAPFVAGVVDLKKIKNSIEKITPLCDILIIEGAGGIRVPIKMVNGWMSGWEDKSSEFQVPGSEFQVIEMWELAKIFNAKLFLVISSKLGMINDFLLNKYFLESQNIKYEWAINLMDENYFKISHPFLKQFNPLFIQKDLDKIIKKIIGE